MGDDWRLRTELQDDNARELTERMNASKLAHDLETSFHDRVIVSVDGPEVFCYAGTREQAEKAESAIRSLAAERGWPVDCELMRWHPTAEEWRDPDELLPQSDADRAAERAAVIERERRESRAQGYPEFEVRVQCPSHTDTVQLAEKLSQDGLEPVRRWKFLLLGAPDEDSANRLAERIRDLAPSGSIVTAEGTLGAVLAEQPRNPFAFLGGLAG